MACELHNPETFFDHGWQIADDSRWVVRVLVDILGQCILLSVCIGLSAHFLSLLTCQSGCHQAINSVQLSIFLVHSYVLADELVKYVEPCDFTNFRPMERPNRHIEVQIFQTLPCWKRNVLLQCRNTSSSRSEMGQNCLAHVIAFFSRLSVIDG